MTAILEDPEHLLKFRILSNDTVYYCIYDLGKGEYKGAYHDKHCQSPAGLWAWQEREIIDQIKQYVKAKVS